MVGGFKDFAQTWNSGAARGINTKSNDTNRG